MKIVILAAIAALSLASCNTLSTLTPEEKLFLLDLAERAAEQASTK